MLLVVNFRSRAAPCTVEYLKENTIRNSIPWAIMYSLAVLVFMARCTRFELILLFEDFILLVIDIAAIMLISVDLFLKNRLFGLKAVLLDIFVLSICFGDSLYIYYKEQFSFLTVIRVYFVVMFSEATINACRNSVWCLQKVLTAISIQALSWFFFSCLCVVFFGLDDPMFCDLPNALVNMFALITTSNNPDVWLHMYALNRTNVLLFLCYLFVSVFFLQNYVAVTIFSEFSQLTNESIHVRQQHRHKSLLMAFEILDIRKRNTVDPNAVYALLRYMRPNYSTEKIRVLYGCIDPDDEFRAISFDRFCRIIDALSIRVSTVYPPRKSRLCSADSFLYSSVFYLVPLLNMLFVAFVCLEGKMEMLGSLFQFTIIVALGLFVLSLLLLFLDICAYGIKTNLKFIWIYITIVELVLSAVHSDPSQHTYISALI